MASVLSSDSRRSGSAVVTRRLSSGPYKTTRFESRRRPSEDLQADLDPEVECAVYSWGCGEEYRLGTGDCNDRMSPAIVLHARCAVRGVACGAMHTIMLINPSRVLTWGEGQHGQLGHATGNDAQSFQPAIVTTLENMQIIQIGAGGHSSFAMTSDTALYTWGDNTHGQLGLGNGFKGQDSVFTPTEVFNHWDAAEMKYRKINYNLVVIGKRHCVAVDKDHFLFSWGDNSCGQLGHGDKLSRNSPVRVHHMSKIRQIALGCRHSAAVDERGFLWTWGDAGEGRLGHGTMYKEEKVVKDNVITKTRKKIETVLEPKALDFFRTRGLRVQSVACGERFCVALLGNGTLWSWGAGIFGQLGHGRDRLSCDGPERIQTWPAGAGGAGQQSMWWRRQQTESAHDQTATTQHSSPRPPRAQRARKSAEDAATAQRRRTSSALSGGDVSQTWALEHDASLQWRHSEEASGQDHVFRHVIAGPYHAMAVSTTGAVFSWGKGSRGVLGNGGGADAYEPVEVAEVEGEGVRLVACGERHAVVVGECSRHDLWDRGFNYQPLANTDELLSLVEPPGMVERGRAGSKGRVDRYGPQPRFNQVVGVGEEGTVVIETGEGKSTEGSVRTVRQSVRLQDIVGTNPLSLKAVRNELQSAVAPIIADADAFLQAEGWDLLDDPKILSSDQMHPLLEAATPTDVRNVLNQWRETAEAQTQAQPVNRTPSAVSSSPMLPLTRQRTGTQQTLRQAMAAEDDDIFAVQHEKVVDDAKRRVLYHHNRQPAQSVSCQMESSARRPADNGKDAVACSSVFGQATRFPDQTDDEHPGPGQYSPTLPQNGSGPQRSEIVRPCGVGVTLMLKEKFIGEAKSTFLDNSAHKFEIVVKHVVPGGAVDNGNRSKKCTIAPGDVIYRIEDYAPKDLHEARALLTGEPDTVVRITYRHKDKSGTGPQMRVGLRRRYIGMAPTDRINAAYPTSGGYVGLGLRAPRFGQDGSDATDEDLLTEEQEEAVLAVIRRIQEEHTQENINFLKSRHCMVPALAGLKTVLEESVRLYPEWEDDLKQGPALIRLYKKHGFVDANNFGDNKNNVWNGPGTHHPQRTAVHNWSESGEVVSSSITMANMTGALTWHPETSKSRRPEPATVEEMSLAAERQVLGRPLGEGEWDTLTREKQRHIAQAAAILSKEVGGAKAPGPADYDPADYDSIGGPRVGHQIGRAGHHVKGVTLAGKDNSRPPVEVCPGPGQYPVRREGLDASGDFAARRGQFRYLPDCAPARVEVSHGGPALYQAPTAFSSLGASEIRKTLLSSAAIVHLKGREGMQYARRVEEKLTLDPLSREYVPDTPGPGAYTPRRPDTTRNFSMPSRDGLLCDKMRDMFRMAWDPVEMEWFDPEAGPQTYTPLVTKDGQALAPGAAAHAFSLQARPMSKDQDVTPGPADYELPSSFDPEHSPTRPGITNTNSGWMGERFPASKPDHLHNPGPGVYDPQAYDAVGSDMVAIGAAERAAHGMTSTEAARLEQAGKPTGKEADGVAAPRSRTNYSEMNKAVERFKKELSLRFKSVYDAFAFFDINGDWAVTPAEFRQMLHVLGVSLSDQQLDLVIRRLDTVEDGSIDPKEFVSSLRWHHRSGERPKDVETEMQKASRSRARIVKEAMQKKLELQIIDNVRNKKYLKPNGDRSTTSSPSPPPSRKPERTIKVRPTRPLSARTDMRKGVSIGVKSLRADHHTSKDTPGPARYFPFGSQDIGNLVGAGKDLGGRRVQDSTCWAGSGNTTRAAFLAQRTDARFVKHGFTKVEFMGAHPEASCLPGPGAYSLQRFPSPRPPPTDDTKLESNSHIVAGSKTAASGLQPTPPTRRATGGRPSTARVTFRPTDRTSAAQHR